MAYTLKYLPTLVLINNEFKPISGLTYDERLMVLSHGKNIENIIGRPLYEKCLKKCTHSIIKYGGSFSDEEYLKIKEFAFVNAYYILNSPKDFIASKQKWAQLFLCKNNVIKEYLQEYGIYDNFKALPDLQKSKRAEKFLGKFIIMPDELKPSVSITPNYHSEGCIFISEAYMKKCNKYFKKKGIDYRITYGSKSAFCFKSIIFPLVGKQINCDLIVPESENKLKLSVEQISKVFAVNPDIDSKKAFSRNLRIKVKGGAERIGRIPTLALDTCSFLSTDLNFDKIQIYRDMLDEKLPKEQVAEMLFSYEVKETVNGEEKNVLKYNKYGEAILNGASIYDKAIEPHAFKVITNSIMRSMLPKVKGIYGQALPKHLIQHHKGHKETYQFCSIIRYPQMVSIKVDVTLVDNIIYVPEDLWLLMGGDYDGDNVTVFTGEVSCFFDWSKEEDRNELYKLLKMPQKEKSNDKMLLIDAQKLSFDQTTKIGQTYNANKVIVWAYIEAGLDIKSAIKIDIYNNATLTQQNINGVKHSASKIAKVDTTFIDNYIKEHQEQIGIEILPVLPNNIIEHSKLMYNAFKYCYDIRNIINMSKNCKSDSRNYFERQISRFKDWTYKRNIL